MAACHGNTLSGDALRVLISNGIIIIVVEQQKHQKFPVNFK